MRIASFQQAACKSAYCVIFALYKWAIARATINDHALFVTGLVCVLACTHLSAAAFHRLQPTQTLLLSVRRATKAFAARCAKASTVCLLLGASLHSWKAIVSFGVCFALLAGDGAAQRTFVPQFSSDACDLQWGAFCLAIWMSSYVSLLDWNVAWKVFPVPQTAALIVAYPAIVLAAFVADFWRKQPQKEAVAFCKK